MNRPFDWSRDCPDAVGRSFPAIIGRGRGQTLGSRIYRNADDQPITRSEFVKQLLGESPSAFFSQETPNG